MLIVIKLKVIQIQQNFNHPTMDNFVVVMAGL